MANPTVTSVNATTPDGAYRAGNVIDLTVTFSETVNVTGMPQLMLSTGGWATYMSGSGSTTLTFRYLVQAGENSADLDYSDTAALGLNGGTIENIGDEVANLLLPTPGTSGSLGANAALVIDTAAPGAPTGLSLSADSGVSGSDFITNTAAQTIGATLSGALAGGEVLYGSLDGGSTWTDITSKVSGVTVTWNGVTLPGSGTLQLKVADAAGNEGAVASQVYAVDTTAPTVAITSNVSTLKAGETANITFTFSEDPGASFTWDGGAGDVVVSGGTLGAISGSGLTRTAIFTPTNGIDTGTASVTVGAGSYADVAGNLGGAGMTPSLAFDTLPPSAPSAPTLAAASDSGASSTDGVTNDDTPTFTGTAEAGVTVTLYDSDGVTVLGSDVAAGGAWEITASALSEGAHSLIAKAADSAGNVSGASVAAAVTIDNTGPTATIVLADSSLQNGEATQVTVTFSEAVTGFTSSDLVATHGVLSALSTSDNIVYTATLTAPAVGAHASNTITLTNGGVEDAAGNIASGVNASANYTIDAAPPTPQPEPGVVTVVTPDGNQVTGDAEDNLIAPSGGADTVSGGAGNDTVQGGAGGDVLQGNIGDDSIAAGDGADLVYGGQSQDFLQGNGGADQLFGDKGEDTVHGGQGADFVQGGQGDDFVFGDLGDDVVLGGQGNDWVFGGAGNDYLSGDLGSDTLSGGAGADVFRSFGGAGLDLVTDFNQAEGDRVLLDPGTSYVLSQVGGDVHITMTGGAELVLAGVQLSGLSSGWISA